MQLSKRIKSKSVLPVSAMSDIAFLLLIFFMLSSISDEDREIDIELPNSRISVQEEHKFFNVWLNDKGELFFNSKKGNAIALTTFAMYKLRANPDVRALIRASKNIEYQKVDTIFTALKEAGIHHIVLVSEKRR